MGAFYYQNFKEFIYRTLFLKANLYKNPWLAKINQVIAVSFESQLEACKQPFPQPSSI